MANFISETSDMTSEGLGEKFEGDFVDTCAGKFPSGGSRVRRPGGEDPHRC